MQPIWIFRHIACEGLGYLSETFKHHSLEWELFAVDEGCDIPISTVGSAGMVFLGGPMSVNDSDAWIAQELKLIQAAHQQDLPILGHCLGAQLIAKAMGAKITSNPVREIGWHSIKQVNSAKLHPIMESIAEEFTVFHWHGETFSIPNSATALFTSADCQNQAFAAGNTLALQYHLEVTPDMVDKWSKLYANQLELSASIQSRETMLAQHHNKCDNMHQIADSLYQNWLKYSGLIQ